MPGGRFDSSKTRVVPVFERLKANVESWTSRLLALPEHGAAGASRPHGLDLTFIRGFWGEDEARLPPPISLLSWLVRNPEAWGAHPDSAERQRLAAKDPATISEALDRIGTPSVARAWYLLEGATAPDAYIETPDAILVIEGKRTEAGPTTNTKWLPGRHQMWRHIDAAWERAGRRRVFGFFIVESTNPALPGEWCKHCEDLLSHNVLATSFPHRGEAEVQAIANCFIGATTWQRICAEFQLPDACLLDTVPHHGT